MHIGLTGVLIITLQGAFVLPSTINYLENDNAFNDVISVDYLEPTKPREVCVFGFDFNSTDGECHLILNLAGKMDKNNTDIFIVCPSGYIYSGGKLCTKKEGRNMIDAPRVCSPNANLDPNGICRDVYN